MNTYMYDQKQHYGRILNCGSWNLVVRTGIKQYYAVIKSHNNHFVVLLSVRLLSSNLGVIN